MAETLSGAGEDFAGILLEIGEVHKLEKQTFSSDTMGTVSSVAESDIYIHLSFQDITIKDRIIHDMGLAKQGNRKFFMLPVYTFTSAGIETDYEIEEGDILIDTVNSDQRWRVIKILKEWEWPSENIFKVGIAQAIDLE